MFGARFQTDFFSGHRSLAFAVLAALLILSTRGAVAAPPSPGTAIQTVVSLSYTGANAGTAQVAQSNPASFLVVQKYGVALSPASAAQNATSGQTVCTFPVTLQNTGNGSDTFNLMLTLPDRWGGSLVADNGGSGQYLPADISPLGTAVTLAAGQACHAFLVVTLPSPFLSSGTITLRAASQADAGQAAVAAMQITAPPTPLSQNWTIQTNGPVRCEPTIAGGVAYIGSDDGSLYAIAATGASGSPPGTVLWRAATGAAVRCTPAVYIAPNGQELVSVGNEGGQLFTLDAQTGQILWTALVSPLQTQSWYSRPLVSADGSRVTVTGDGYRLWTFHTLDGSVAVKAQWRDPRLVGNPAVCDETGRAWIMSVSGWGTEVLNGVPGRRLYLRGVGAGSLVTDPVQGCLIGTGRRGRVVSYDPVTLLPNAHWAAMLPALLAPVMGGVDVGAPITTSPVLDTASGMAYVATAGHKIYALHTVDGTLLGGGWPFVPAAASALDAFQATPLLWPSLTAAAPTLYEGDTDGGFYAVPADNPAGATLFMPPPGMPPPGEWDAPAAASGLSAQDVVVVGNTNGVVYCLSLR